MRRTLRASQARLHRIRVLEYHGTRVPWYVRVCTMVRTYVRTYVDIVVAIPAVDLATRQQGRPAATTCLSCKHCCCKDAVFLRNAHAPHTTSSRPLPMLLSPTCACVAPAQVGLGAKPPRRAQVTGACKHRPPPPTTSTNEMVCLPARARMVCVCACMPACVRVSVHVACKCVVSDEVID